MHNYTLPFQMFGYHVNLERTWVFFLLPVFILLCLLPYFLTPRNKRGGAVHIIAMVARCLTMAVATFLLAGVTFTQVIDQPKNVSMVIVVDYSESVQDVSPKMESYVLNLIDGLDENTSVKIIKFSGNAIEVSPDFEVDKSVIKKNFESNNGAGIEKMDSTNLEDAIIAATKALRDADQTSASRMVIVSDGRETTGNAMDAAAEAAAQDIRVDTVTFDITQDEDFSEVALTSVGVLPDHVLDVGKTVRMSVNIRSSVEVKGKLKFYFDGVEKQSMPVSLVQGENLHYKTYTTAGESVGIHELSVKFVPDDNSDAITENNELSTWIKLTGSPQVLIVGTDVEARNMIAKQVETIYDVTCTSPTEEAMPTTMQELLKYDEVILMNIKKTQLTEQFTEMLERYVMNVGRGLFTTTGDSEETYMSYGGENWNEEDSPLARLLPIKMTLDETLYNTAIVLVIDDSSSMIPGTYNQAGGDKFEAAKKGAIEVINALGEHDYVGIVTFHQEATIQQDLIKPTDKEALADLINELSAKDHFNTDYSKGLALARNLLKNFNSARSKHVIFLSDGYPNKGDHDRIPSNMKEDGITLHTIALLTDKGAKEMLAEMAEQGGGNTYSVDTEEDLGSVADVMKGWAEDAREPQFYNNEPFNPLVGDDTGVLNLVNAPAMTLGGYIGSTLKDGADMPLHTNDFRPLIAEWDYGYGHVTSVLTDITGEWGVEFFSEENGGLQLVKNLVKQSLNEEVSVSGLTLGITQDELRAQVKVKSTYSELGEMELLINGIDTVVLTETNGQYSGFFDTPNPADVYRVVATLYEVGEDGKRTGDVLDQTSLAYSGGVIAEYDIFNIDGDAVMEGIANTGGGEKMQGGVDGPEKLTQVELPAQVENVRDGLVPCAIALAVMLMLDIIVRQIDFGALFRRRRNR